MCCMWSTWNPPDIIEGTKPFRDIEAAFGIRIDEDDALAFYDMDLEQATKKIVKIKKENANNRFNASGIAGRRRRPSIPSR